MTWMKKSIIASDSFMTSGSAIHVSPSTIILPIGKSTWSRTL